MSWDFLKSRAFWSAVPPIVSAVCILLEVGEEKRVAILGIVAAVAGYWGVTAVRYRKGEPTSYAEATKR